MSIYLYANHGETPDEAWAESEGLYVCANHIEQARTSVVDRFIVVPEGLASEVQAQGQCEFCWDNWAESERRRHEADAQAYWDA